MSGDDYYFNYLVINLFVHSWPMEVTYLNAEEIYCLLKENCCTNRRVIGRIHVYVLLLLSLSNYRQVLIIIGSIKIVFIDVQKQVLWLCKLVLIWGDSLSSLFVRAVYISKNQNQRTGEFLYVIFYWDRNMPRVANDEWNQARPR